MNVPGNGGVDIMVPRAMESVINYTDYLQNNHNIDNTVDAIFASHLSSFYTLQEAPTIILICIYVPVFLVAFIGNALLLAIVLPHRTVWGVTSSFLVNLALADILVAVVCIPMTVAEKVYRLWVYGDVMCKAANFLQGVSVTASTYTLAVMSMDRCLAIRHPMKCRSIRTSGNVRTLLIFIWIFSAIIISPLLFLRKTVSHEILPSKYLTYCVENWPSGYTRQIYDVVLLVVLYAIPGTVVIVSYSLMGRRLWTPDKTLEHSRRQNSSHIKNRPNDSIMAGRRNLARMLIVMAALFAACWLPYYIIVTYTDFAADEDKASALDLLSFSLVLGHLNSAVNPILYSFMNKTFRKYMKRLLSCQRRKRQSTTNEKGFLLAQMSWKTKSVRSTFISSFRGKPNCATPSTERRSPSHSTSPRRKINLYGTASNGDVHNDRQNMSPRLSFKSLWDSRKRQSKSTCYDGELFVNYEQTLNIPTTIGEEVSEYLKTSSSSQTDFNNDQCLLNKSLSKNVTKCDLHSDISKSESQWNYLQTDLQGENCEYDCVRNFPETDPHGGKYDWDAQGSNCAFELHRESLCCDLEHEDSSRDLHKQSPVLHQSSDFHKSSDCSLLEQARTQDNLPKKSFWKEFRTRRSDGDLYKRTAYENVSRSLDYCNDAMCHSRRKVRRCDCPERINPCSSHKQLPNCSSCEKRTNSRNKPPTMCQSHGHLSTDGTPNDPPTADLPGNNPICDTQDVPLGTTCVFHQSPNEYSPQEDDSGDNSSVTYMFQSDYTLISNPYTDLSSDECQTSS